MAKFVVFRDNGRETVEADTFWYDGDNQTLTFTKDVGEKRLVVMFYPNPKTTVRSVQRENE